MENTSFVDGSLMFGHQKDSENQYVPEIPSLVDFYKHLSTFVLVATIVGSIIFLLTCAGYVRFVYMIMHKSSSKLKSNIIVLGTLYPVVSLCALISILFPNMAAIGDAAMQITFTICAYHFYNLCFKYVDGHKQFLKQAESTKLNLKTPPCCCCCVCLHPVDLNKERLSFTRYMVLQMPVFQSVLMVTLNIIYVEQISMYQNVHLYLAPFIAASILIGTWGLHIVTRAITPEVPNQKLRLKFLCLQLVIMCCKFQASILTFGLNYVDFRGHYPMTHLVQKNVTINLIIIIQNWAISILANRTYETTTEDVKREPATG